MAIRRQHTMAPPSGQPVSRWSPAQIAEANRWAKRHKVDGMSDREVAAYYLRNYNHLAPHNKDRGR